jgi:hypothetical protein
MKSGRAKQAVVEERTRDGDPLPEAADAGPGEASHAIVDSLGASPSP